MFSHLSIWQQGLFSHLSIWQQAKYTCFYNAVQYCECVHFYRYHLVLEMK